MTSKWQKMAKHDQNMTLQNRNDNKNDKTKRQKNDKNKYSTTL
jgi:hypothetical protein